MDNSNMDLAVKLEKVDSRSRSNEHRIEKVEANMEKIQDTQITLVKLANGIDKMAEQLVDMKEDIKDVKSGQDELSEEVNALKNRPATETKKRWDEIRDKVVLIFIGGLATWLLYQVIPAIRW